MKTIKILLILLITVVSHTLTAQEVTFDNQAYVVKNKVISLNGKDVSETLTESQKIEIYNLADTKKAEIKAAEKAVKAADKEKRQKEKQAKAEAREVKAQERERKAAEKERKRSEKARKKSEKARQK